MTPQIIAKVEKSQHDRLPLFFDFFLPAQRKQKYPLWHFLRSGEVIFGILLGVYFTAIGLSVQALTILLKSISMAWDLS